MGYRDVRLRSRKAREALQLLRWEARKLTSKAQRSTTKGTKQSQAYLSLSLNYSHKQVSLLWSSRDLVMALASTSFISQLSGPKSLTQCSNFSGLRKSSSKLELSHSPKSLSATESLFQHFHSHLRLSSSRKSSRGVVAMAGSGKVLHFLFFSQNSFLFLLLLLCMFDELFA